MGSYEYQRAGGSAHLMLVTHVGTGRAEGICDAQDREVIVLSFHGRYRGQTGMFAVAVRIEEAALLINGIRIAAEDRGVWPAIQALLDQVTATARAEGWTIDGGSNGAGSG